MVGFWVCQASLSSVYSTVLPPPIPLLFKSPLVSSPCMELCHSPQPPVASHHHCLSLQSLESFSKSPAHLFSTLFLKFSAGVGRPILSLQGLLAACRLKVQLLGAVANPFGDPPSLSCPGLVRYCLYNVPHILWHWIEGFCWLHPSLMDCF